MVNFDSIVLNYLVTDFILTNHTTRSKNILDSSHLHVYQLLTPTVYKQKVQLKTTYHSLLHHPVVLQIVVTQLSPKLLLQRRTRSRNELQHCRLAGGLKAGAGIPLAEVVLSTANQQFVDVESALCAFPAEGVEHLIEFGWQLDFVAFDEEIVSVEMKSIEMTAGSDPLR